VPGQAIVSVSEMYADGARISVSLEVTELARSPMPGAGPAIVPPRAPCFARISGVISKKKSRSFIRV
jgi:hypothetical protein